MAAVIRYIPLDKIQPLIDSKNTDAYLKRMKKLATSGNLHEYDLLLPVEKDMRQDLYYLVGGYDRYEYLQRYTNERLAPCIVEETSANNVRRFFKLLNRFTNRGDTTKHNIQTTLNLLRENNVNMESITRETTFTESYIRTNYEYHKNIPAVFIGENASEKTMNWIESLPLDDDVKYFLYGKANLNVGDSNRLTKDSMKMINKLLKKEPRFRYLTPDAQKHILNCAINFKGIVLSLLQSQVEELLRTNNPPEDEGQLPFPR